MKNKAEGHTAGAMATGVLVKIPTTMVDTAVTRQVPAISSILTELLYALSLNSLLIRPI